MYTSYISKRGCPELVEEIRRRLNSIKIDAVLESGYIEQFIEDNHWSIFPTISNTEKPDKVVVKCWKAVLPSWLTAHLCPCGAHGVY